MIEKFKGYIVSCDGKDCINHLEYGDENYTVFPDKKEAQQAIEDSDWVSLGDKIFCLSCYKRDMREGAKKMASSKKKK